VAFSFLLLVQPPAANAHAGRHVGQTLVDHVFTSFIDFGAMIVLALPLIALLRHAVRSGRTKRFAALAGPALAGGGLVLALGGYRAIAHVLWGTQQAPWYVLMGVMFAGSCLVIAGLLTGDSSATNKNEEGS